MSDQKKNKKPKRYHFKLAIQIFLLSFVLSILMSTISQSVMSKAQIIVALIALLVIIFIGVTFDIIGVAVATADPAPFHAMAAKHNKRAVIALKLLKKASLVATFSNDVIGDIAGIVSGAAVATIVFKLSAISSWCNSQWLNVIMSSIAAGLTVGGKAIGKELAINQSKEIVYFVSTIIYDLKVLLSFQWFKKGN